MFLEFKEKSVYYKKYVEMLAIRTAYSSLSLEFHNGDLSLPERAIDIMNFKNAIEYIFENQNFESRIYPPIMVEVNALINSEKGIPKGYRKVQVVTGLDFEAPEPRFVPMKIMDLLNNYYNIWCDLDVFEREARFAIEFIRIQPFEDGNKRTACILTNYNLCNSLNGPVIIYKENVKEYLDCIVSRDVKKLADLFRKLSRVELSFMVDFYKQIQEKVLSEEVRIFKNSKNS